MTYAMAEIRWINGLMEQKLCGEDAASFVVGEGHSKELTLEAHQ